MAVCLSARRVASAIGFAFVVAATAVGAPNTSDLRGLAGTYRGTGEVALGQDPTYSGRTIVRAKALDATSLQVRIDGEVRTPRGRVPVDNVLTFATSGAMRMTEIAPGITRRAPLKGAFGASPTRIAFEGTYEFGESKGRVTGTLRKNPTRGLLFLTYSVFGEGQTAAIYTYTYELRGPKTP